MIGYIKNIRFTYQSDSEKLGLPEEMGGFPGRLRSDAAARTGAFTPFSLAELAGD
jgi:hypothetical protein